MIYIFTYTHNCTCISGNRTKEQLGYTVQCGPRVTSAVFGFCFYVQSSEYNPIYLQGRVDNFINGLEELLVSIQSSSLILLLKGLWPP
jgi:nardilysin